MANITQTLTIDTTKYPNLLNQNVKVYSFDSTSNTYACIGVSNVDSSGSITITAPQTGTYFIAPLDCPIFDTNNMTLVYEDTFDYTGLPNSDNWTYGVGNNNGWGNDELEYYQDANPANVNVDNGILTLTALYDATGITQGGKTYNYTSTRMYSKQSWLYGKVEVSAILPSAVGTWPAIWMMPVNSTFGEWPLSGEIDIMEMMNNVQDIVHGSLQSEDQYFKSKPYKNTAIFPVKDSNTTYHVYGCTWTPEWISFEVDGVEYFKFARDLGATYSSNNFPWTIPFYLILNIAIGGSSGGTVTSSDFPQSMKVNSVKIYDLGFENYSLNDDINTSFTFNAPVPTIPLQSSFDTSVVGWRPFSQSPAVVTPYLDNAYCFDINNAGSANWNIQLVGATNAITQGTTYYYTVNLTSTIDRQIGIGVQNPNANTPYFTHVYDITSGSNTIKGSFTASASLESANFLVYLGKNNVSLVPHTIEITSVLLDNNNVTPSSITTPFEVSDFAKLGNKRGVFSWNANNLLTNTVASATTCNQLEITELYQAIPLADLTSSLTTTIETFNKTAPNTQICQCIGSPSWYNTSSPAMTQLQGIVNYNKTVDAAYQITKVVLDVEPWSLTSNWENDYITVLNTLHSYTKANGITLAITLPYWMSTTVGASTTYSSIMGAVDEVLFMNYNRNCYDTCLNDEVATAKANNQQIFSIAELQTTEQTGLTANETYAGVGLQQLFNNWTTLSTQYNYANLGFAFDDLEALQALLN